MGYKNCLTCGTRLTVGKQRYYIYHGSQLYNCLSRAIGPAQISGGSCVCDKCHKRIIRSSDYANVSDEEDEEHETVQEEVTVRTNDQSPVNTEEVQQAVSAPDLFELRSRSIAPPVDNIMITTVPCTELMCFICGSTMQRNRIPQQTIALLWVNQTIMVPMTNRSCAHHIDQGTMSFTEHAMNIIHQHKFQAQISASELMKLVEQLTSLLKGMQTQHCQMVNFDDPNLDDRTFNTLLGISKAHFLHLFSFCAPHLHRSLNRTTKNAVAIFLMKLRMDISQEQIAVFFNTDQQRVSETIERVSEILEEHFVPNYLGYHHISRQELIDRHSTVLSNVLTKTSPNVPVVILDGTTIDIQKSSNFELQKQTYSMHKFKNVVKAMVVCAPTGYIIAIEGMYLSDGHNNDAAILNMMFETRVGFDMFFCNGGATLVLDRGFRDSIVMAEALGYQVAMPNLLDRSQKQFTSEEANESRLVTKVRWVVESVNGRIKNVFKFFRNVVPNKYLDGGKLGRFLKIACAMLNAYYPVLYVDKPGDRDLANYMIERSELTNLLEDRLIRDQLITRRVVWIAVKADEILDFPRLSHQDLLDITIGVFQVNMAPSYAARFESLRSTTEIENCNPIVHYHKDNSDLLRFRMASRFHTGQDHQLWIHYEPNSTRGPYAIKAWFCQCKSGARIVGCCAHVACLLWFLGLARHQTEIRFPAQHLGDSLLNARKPH